MLARREDVRNAHRIPVNVYRCAQAGKADRPFDLRESLRDDQKAKGRQSDPDDRGNNKQGDYDPQDEAHFRVLRGMSRFLAPNEGTVNYRNCSPLMGHMNLLSRRKSR
jgi:hypothetical protein